MDKGLINNNSGKLSDDSSGKKKIIKKKKDKKDKKDKQGKQGKQGKGVIGRVNEHYAARVDGLDDKHNNLDYTDEKKVQEQLSKEARNELVRQHYKIVGTHSAVKTCGWTRSMLRGKGGCYKLKFYGIMSHQCLQMSTSISCANRCTFCWRGYKAPVSKKWEWAVDDPDKIIDDSIEAQKKLLIGFRGSDTAQKKLVKESETVRHVALSLTGEPIIYPKINELIRKFHKKKISTFLVTNAQYPEEIKNLEPVTQLYLSVDAPNKRILKKVDRPLFPDYWERLQRSLKYASEKEGRTAIRITVIKGINDIEPENYARLIELGNPDFVEVKAYMYIGASMERLERDNMPIHKHVKEFTEKILDNLSDYEISSEHIPSRVVLLSKKSYKGETWINFDEFFKRHG